MLRYKIRLINNLLQNPTNPDALDWQQIWKSGSELYSLCSELLGSSVSRIGPFPQLICRQFHRPEKMVEACNELYWITQKSRHKPDKKSKWQYLHPRNAHPHPLPKKYDLNNVFDCSERNRFKPGITFNVRNWKQRPSQLLKKKMPSQQRPVSTSSFAALSCIKLKVFSKTFFCSPLLNASDPVELIL